MKLSTPAGFNDYVCHCSNLQLSCSQLKSISVNHPVVQQVSWAEEQFGRASNALVAA